MKSIYEGSTRKDYRTMKNGIRGEIHDGRLAEASKRGLE